jgi:hypothetical protein
MHAVLFSSLITGMKPFRPQVGKAVALIEERVDGETEVDESEDTSQVLDKYPKQLDSKIRKQNERVPVVTKTNLSSYFGDGTQSQWPP